jgi:hypothetical protein
MSFDASAGTLRCPFCGSEQLNQQQDVKVLRPQRVVPFVAPKAAAVEAMRKWLGQGFWRPGDLSQQALVVSMTPVYVPYWIFSATTHTNWTADTNQTPPGASASWYPLAGEHHGEHAGIVIGASGALTPEETSALCPFDMTTAVPPEQVDLENMIEEQFSVPRKYARPIARQALEQREAQQCEQAYVPGNCRNMQVNVLVEGLSSEPVLLPVWMMAYRYRNEVFRFLLNGQSGRATGRAPVSWKKITTAIVIACIVLLLIVLALVAH